MGGDPDMERTIRMVNLRYEIKSEQIESFFKDFNPERGSVNFTMMNGMPTGKWVALAREVRRLFESHIFVVTLTWMAG